MEKRVVLFFLISVAILGSWYFLFPPPKAVPPPPVPAAQEQPKAPDAPAAAPGQVTPAPGAAAPVGGAREPEQRTTFDRPGLYHAVFSSVDAAPVEFTLLDKQYKITVDGKDLPIELIKKEAGRPPFVTAFAAGGADAERSDFDLPQGTAWKVVRASDEEVVYAADAGTVHVEKRWSVPKAGYSLGLEVTVENKGDKPAQARLLVAVDGYQDPNVKAGGMSFGKRVNVTEGLCDVAGKLKNEGLEESQKKPLTESGDVKWVGYGEHFFLVAGALGGDALPRTCHIAGNAGGRIDVRAVYSPKSVAPGGRQSWSMAAFLGPKMLQILDDVTVPEASGPVDARLADALNYRVLGIDLEFIARPMLFVLKKIHTVVLNWGVAIILITILLKLITLYPTQKSMQSMKSMAKLKPEMDRIKEQFADDKARQNTETMALYKKHGVNPFGGCLPMLLQMPIYMAFYAMLSNAVELYRASFVGPIRDMTSDFWPLAVATGILMFLQQRSSPQAADPQQRTMMYMMPIMFMAFTAMLPSGLTLYILTNTLLTMLHQWFMNRNDPDKRKVKEGKSPKPARA